MKLITTELFEKISLEASASPRQRKNYNFHTLEEPVQRFLNVLQPSTYVTPHKHAGLDAFEFYCVLQGSVGLIIFDAQGDISDSYVVSANGPTRGIEMPGEVFHTLVCLEENTVILEIKEGPYDPQGMKYPLAGFPEEIQFLQSGANSEIGKKVLALISHWKKTATSKGRK